MILGLNKFSVSFVLLFRLVFDSFGVYEVSFLMFLAWFCKGKMCWVGFGGK